jgi:hypothetical protein
MENNRSERIPAHHHPSSGPRHRRRSIPRNPLNEPPQPIHLPAPPRPCRRSTHTRADTVSGERCRVSASSTTRLRTRDAGADPVSVNRTFLSRVRTAIRRSSQPSHDWTGSAATDRRGRPRWRRSSSTATTSRWRGCPAGRSARRSRGSLSPGRTAGSLLGALAIRRSTRRRRLGDIAAPTVVVHTEGDRDD